MKKRKYRMTENQMEHMIFLLKEIRILEKRIQPHDTGHIHTTIRTLDNRVKEIQDKIDQHNRKYVDEIQSR